MSATELVILEKIEKLSKKIDKMVEDFNVLELEVHAVLGRNYGTLPNVGQWPPQQPYYMSDVYCNTDNSSMIRGANEQ